MDHEPWQGDSPFYILLSSLEPNEGGAFGHCVVDVDLTGWQEVHADWIRRSAEWYLCAKETDRVVLTMLVYRGEQPYYVKRHVGQIRLNDSASRSVAVFGIGKKVPAVYETVDGKRKLVRPKRTERLWVLPGGVICGGDDVEPLAMSIVQTLDWQEANPDGEVVSLPDHRERDGGEGGGAGVDDRAVPAGGRRRRSGARRVHPGQ